MRGILALAIVLLVWGGASATLAQQTERERARVPRAQNRDEGEAQKPDGERPNRAPRERRAGRDGGANEGFEGEGEGGGEGRFGALPFHPAKDDFGPLKPGEEPELMQFAQTEVPTAFERLDRMRRNAPGEFRQRLRDAAPRLRFLKRLFRRNPDLGRVLVEHIDTSLTIQRMVRTFRQRAEAGSPRAQQQAIRELMRRLRDPVTKRFELEERALDLHVTELVNTRDERSAARVAELLAPGAELTDVPPELGALVEKYRSSDDRAAREALQVQIADGVLAQLEAEITTMRERLAQSREDRQQRVERFLNEVGRRRGRDKP